MASSTPMGSDNTTPLEGLPFLVTHWLANFANTSAATTTTTSNNGITQDENEERRRAVERIRHASAEIASAFSSLGAFGTTRPPSFSNSLTQEIVPHNATYSDVRRRWNGISSSHLEQIAFAVASTNAVVETSGAAAAATQMNLLQAVTETGGKAGTTSGGNGSGGATSGGRTAQDAITLEDNQQESEPPTSSALALQGLSILYPPLLVSGASPQEGPNSAAVDDELFSNLQADRPERNSPPLLQARSGYLEVGQQTAATMRNLLDLRAKVQLEKQEIQGLNDSMAKQAIAVMALEEKYRLVCADGLSDMTRMLEVTDEVKAGKQECERVTAQLQRKLVDLTSTLQTDNRELGRLETEIILLDTRRKGIVRSSRDPCWSWPGSLAPGSRIGANPILQTVIGRQQGLSRPRNNAMFARSAILQGPNEPHFVATRKALLGSRLSHAATINTHISYPVYCLRFDRTGRYFISGADDYLIKVFHLGSGQSSRDKNAQDGSRELRCNYGANVRGAVLVCSLRGHAGVINDIDVSSDNAFLATASVDGDVRVWGLKDGCPVAILRGHKGGANMVSWSKLTPYRLISTGSDGFARMWDIREACLKRYGAQVGKRPEYLLKLTEEEKRGIDHDGESRQSDEVSGTPLPALPVREALPAVPAVAAPAPSGAINESVPPQNQNNEETTGSGGIVVPPLPAAVPPLPGDDAPSIAPNANGQNEIAPPGQFIANDAIDEGVKLLSKYKHGLTGPEVVGPGTRSRRAAVNVICVARCPLGMYFATGSDDGMCRVFKDDEDSGVAIVDARFEVGIRSSKAHRPSPNRNPAARSSDEPVLKLMGHISAITDLAYSNSGDKILSASQKDGVVRIWSLGKPTLDRIGDNGGGVPQIVLKLTDPRSRAPLPPTRRTQGGATRNEGSKVSCDVAVWTHDDSKIITSQSVLVKQNGSDIQPGSQYLFLWDSRTGQCLLGISGAHTMQCPVVVPHPTDSSLVFSAGADGMAKMWDWESGRCIFTHSNKVEFGPVEPAERNKLAGYLDGAFHPDGTMVVLTDDSGRLTILDTIAGGTSSREQSSNAWMREQYFANDYYELFYDQTGYCIERGSEQPPHLAPKGVRCNHTGSPWSDQINEAFSKLTGPSPLPEQISRWQRAEIRRQAASALENSSTISEKQAHKVRRGVREFDPLSTIVIKGPGHVDDTWNLQSKQRSNPTGPIPFGRSPTAERSATNSLPRNMSANYRYLDYEDMMRLQGNQDQEDEEPDSDDEEFSPTARNRGARENSDDDSDNDMDLDDDEVESSPMSGRNRRNRAGHGERHERARRRAESRDDQFVEIGSDDEDVEQIMSTNNTPSGPFVEDYNSHFWRMPTDTVRRKWLKRMESDTSYEGRKTYTPQLGDSVVYIARAHYETINCYPSLQPPWQQWPQGTAWPVVRCCVRGVRFRFPYEDYWRSKQSRCRSLVAILTLEVTGIPELSENREFPWPKPSFVESTGSHVFELSLFENDECEYVFPEGLYTEKLKALESALRNRNSVAGLPVSVYYQSGREDESMEASEGKVEGFVPEEDPTSSPHMSGSGFGVVRVAGFINQWKDELSPWDISMADLSISRPHLADDEKKLLLEKLNAQCRNDVVARHFNLPVDNIRYCDYDRMIEVAMDLMTVKGRLQADYYASKFSVIQDLRLIRDNCIKYNGAVHELVDIAKTMCQEFEAGVLTEEEASILKESDGLMLSMSDSSDNWRAPRAPTIRINLRQRTNRVSAQNHQRNQERTSSRSSRLRRQSSLESLPAPEPRSAPANRRGRARNVQAAASGRRTRSMDSPQVEPQDQGRRSLRSRAQNLESLSRLNESQPGDTENRNAAHTNAGRGQRIRRSIRRVAADSVRDGSDDDEDTEENAHVLDTTASPPSRRATRLLAAELDGIDDEEEEQTSHQETAPRASNRSRGRTSQNEDEEQSFHQVTSPRAARRSRRRTSQNEDEEPSFHQETPPRVARRSRRRTPQYDDDEQSFRQETPPRASSRSRRRSSRSDVADAQREPENDSSHFAEESENECSNEESDREIDPSDPEDQSDAHESDASPPTRISRRAAARQGTPPTRISRRAAARQGTRSSPRAKRPTTAARQEESPARKSSRTRNKRLKPSYEDEPSDFEPSEDEMEDDSDEDKSNSRNRSRTVKSYAELPSDFEEEDGDFSEDGRTARKSRQQRKRKASPAAKRNQSKKSTPAPPQAKSYLKPWPEVDLKLITPICQSMIAMVAKEDHEGNFSVPVLYNFPHLEKDYLVAVGTPMDLQTIREERIHGYENIKQLQDDLRLMLENCCTFNGVESFLGQYAITILNKLNEMFAEVCEAEGVSLGRWRP